MGDNNFDQNDFFSENSFFKNETNRSKRAQFSRFESTKSIFLDLINF